MVTRRRDVVCIGIERSLTTSRDWLIIGVTIRFVRRVTLIFIAVVVDVVIFATTIVIVVVVVARIIRFFR